jgi:hypothetical protein
MLRLISVGNSLPYSWPVHLSATFVPGQFAQLTVAGNAPCATVSNGTAPIGIIDDIKTKAFTAVSWDETVIVPATGVPAAGGRLVSAIDIKAELNNANVSPDSFVSIPVSVQLIPRNGVVVFPAGTELNFDMTGSGTPNAIKTNVRYTYQIPNILGDDSTQGSNRVTVWFQRGIYQTDVFDTSATYPLNANLFVNDKGMLTTKQLTPNHPSVALVTSPPSPLFSWLEFLFL